MTRAELTAAIQAIADEPLRGHANRRKGMTPERAERIVEAVVAEAIAVVEPFVLNQWGGDAVLRRLRDLATTRHVTARHDDRPGSAKIGL